MYPARKKSRWKEPRKALGSIYDAGGGLIGHFDARSVWGRYGGEFGAYAAGVAYDRNGDRVGVVKGATLLHDVLGPVAHSRAGAFVLPGGAPAGRYTGDESGASAAFLLYCHRKHLRAENNRQ